MKSLIVFLAMFAFTSAANFDIKIEPENEVVEKGYPDALARLFVNGLNSTMLGGKYLDFVSSRSVKMRGFSFLSLHAF